MRTFCASIALFVTTINFAQCSNYELTINSTDATCHGFSDGSISASTIGGNGGDQYSITDSSGTIISTTPTLNMLLSGWYYISVIDNMGCLAEDSVFVDQPEQIDLVLTIDHVNCYGDSSGMVTVDTVHNYTGAFNQISYFWSPNPSGNNGIGENSVQNLASGNYTLVINDENGCANQSDFEINEPDQLFFTEFGFDPCSGGNLDGVVFMAAGGGTPPYSYNWMNLDNGDSVSQTTWGGLSYACYEGTIIDGYGCTLKDTTCLSCLSISELNFEWEVYPNPSDGIVTIDGESKELFEIQLLNLEGQLMYQSDNFILGNQLQVNELTTGVYIIKLANSVIVTQKILIID